ncbi:MAG: hydroxypyruvate isomerase family protein [Pirellulales bacterium]|jgi:hydroxypyruvate isomerase
MSNRISRRSALCNVAGLGAATVAAASFPRGLAAEESSPALKGRINHSVCRWCFGKLSLDELCKAAKGMGIKAIDLLGPDEWPVAKKYGLTCSMANGAGMGIGKGFNRIENHDKLVESYEALIPKAAEAGLENVICFSGNRQGLSDEEGAKNCAIGLKRLMKLAESKKVNVVMELLNSKVNHKDYQCDHTEWGAEVCRQVGSERCKLLYDIYHLQIMEGDLIDTIKKNAPYIAHYHTGGVPGRAEIDDTQEIFYPAVMKAIVATGYKGFVAQEFIPRNRDALASLAAAIKICDV